MERSELVAEMLGEHVFDFFLRNKRAEWEEYRRQVTPFELDRYLPVAVGRARGGGRAPALAGRTAPACAWRAGGSRRVPAGCGPRWTACSTPTCFEALGGAPTPTWRSAASSAPTRRLAAGSPGRSLRRGAGSGCLRGLDRAGRAPGPPPGPLGSASAPAPGRGTRRAARRELLAGAGAEGRRRLRGAHRAALLRIASARCRHAARELTALRAVRAGRRGLSGGARRGPRRAAPRRPARLAVIAMGKCGGRELNYISDVDVVFVAAAAEGVDEAAALATATRLASG